MDRSTREPMLITGSWDKTVKFWDLRTPRPTSTLTFEERIYAMDAKDNLLVVATADRKLHIVDLSQRNQVWKTRQSPLTYQVRSISCFADATGFALGSIEGRCAFQWVTDQDYA
jgi:mRNA export factor